MSILIKNGRVIDPANKLDGILDIFIQDDKIIQVAAGIKLKADTVIEAKDKIVIPGIVDMHVHLREPGREDKETVASATAAAAKGGITTVLAMPNTQPAMDSPDNVNLLQEIIKKTAKVNVLVCGAITKGRLGRELSDSALFREMGVYALSDDGVSVDDAGLMLRALLRAKELGLLVICHCEDKMLAAKGVINLGFNSTRLGLRGIPSAAEYTRVKRDIDLAQEAGCPVHIAHVSCKESVEIIERAKQCGVKVTCETAPHYFSFTEEELLGYDTNMKMNPPLRAKPDQEALRQGLKNGTIDAIASDHAPHTENEKDIEFERAEFGVVGLETELAAGITELIDKKILDWGQLVNKLCLNPARILGLDAGTLGEGKTADIAVVSAQEAWTVEKSGLISKSRNSSFLGRTLKGKVDFTLCKGKIVYQK